MSLGQRTIGDYRILEPLGHGGMGVVYSAEHVQTGQQVALKTVRMPRAELLQSIRREIHALARIRHPGIVRILDEGLHEGLPWYAMELLEGRRLRQHCAELAARSLPQGAEALTETSGVQQGEKGAASTSLALELVRADAPPERVAPAPPPGPGSRTALRALLRMPAAGGALLPVLGVVRRLCAPLAFLHGEGIVHRDLKPANILVRPDGMPVLVDFGLAAQSGDELSREALQLEPEATGTVAYMAPEQALKQPVDARADLYALGCILYELLTGRPPFVGKLPVEVLLQHLQVEPRPPSELAEGVPAELDRLVLRLLAKQPRERLGHADDVAAALAKLGAEDGLDPATPQPRAYLYRPSFAGREQPLAMLRGHLDRLAQGKGGIVLIGGESGVGKTRLLVELGREAARQGTEVLAGQCLALGGGPLEAFRKPLQALCDRCQERGPEEAERLFGARGPVLAPFEPAIGQLRGQQAREGPAELPPRDALLRLLRCLADTASAAAARSGELLLLDDLQWADELTLAFLDHAVTARALESVPVLVLGTYRSEEVSGSLQGLLDQGAIERVQLGRLDVEAVAKMVGDMLALVPPPEDFSRFLAGQSEGNPFFVAEYLRAAVAEGLLWRDAGGRWEVAQPETRAAAQADYEALALPRSLRELVGRRLDGLAQDARQLAGAAAVLGRQSSLAVLRQMTGMEETLLFSATDELLRRQVMEEAGDGRLRFVHDKIREGAYQRLGVAERPVLHRAAAEAVEAVLGEERAEQLGELGRHWEAAGEPGKATACYLPAARQAAARYAHQEAERLYRAYLRLVEQPNLESIAARNELGESVLNVRGRYKEALAEHEKALSEARRVEARALEGDSLHGVGSLYELTGRMEDAREAYEQALAISRQLDDRCFEGRVLCSLANLHRDQGRFEAAGQLYEQALITIRQAGDRKGEGRVLGNMAGLRWSQGQMDEARHVYEQALAISRQLGERRFEGIALGNLGLLHMEQGRLDEAWQLYEQALAISRQVGDRRQENIVLGNMACLQHDHGRPEEARQLWEQALAISRQLGDWSNEGIDLGNLGVLHLQQGRLEKGRQLCEQSLDLLRKLGDRRNESLVLRHLAAWHEEHGRVEARQLYEQALAISRQLGDWWNEGIVLGALARVEHIEAPDQPRARELAEEAERLLAAGRDQLELGKVLCCQGHIALASGRGGGKQLERAEALASARGAGADSPLGKAVGRLRRAVAAFEAGEHGRLVRGLLLEELPEGVRQWLKHSGAGRSRV